MIGVVGSTSIIGSLRRAAAIASPSRVCAFSRLRSSAICASQVSRSTTGGMAAWVVSEVIAMLLADCSVRSRRPAATMLANGDGLYFKLSIGVERDRQFGGSVFRKVVKCSTLGTSEGDLGARADGDRVVGVREVAEGPVVVRDDLRRREGG